MTDSPLRICFVSHTPSLSGAERSMLTLMRYLVQQGHQVYAVLPWRGVMQPHLQRIGVTCQIVPYSWWAHNPAIPKRLSAHDSARQIAQHLRQWKIDVVYSNTSVIIVGALAAAFAQVPHVWHPREFISSPDDCPFDDPPQQVIHNINILSNAIICASEVLAQEYRPQVPAAKLHVVPNFAEIDPPQPDPPLPAGLQVDVVLPFHNDPTTIDCLRSLVRHRTPTLGQVHVIDDGTSNVEARDAVRLFIDQHGDLFTYRRHETAQGFVRTVNEGMTLSARDVVLLNTDTVVTAGWLDRLAAVAHSDPRAATVTPLSNNASIFSIPRPNEANEVQDPDATARLLARVSARASIEVFTGHGFCLYIRRSAIQQLGTFDADKYGAGYVEENDFCMRARAAGLKNLIACRAFVQHRGAGSFGSERRQRLIAEHLQKLNADYPEYDSLVRSWVLENPLLDVQASVGALQDKPAVFEGPRLIIVGAVIASKGQADAVQAVAHLHRQGIKAHLLVVGGLASDYVQTVRRLVQEHQLQDHVHLLDYVPYPSSLIQWSDATIVARGNESFGRVTVESMLLGTPVVGARGGGTLELIEDGVTGLLFEPGNSEDLARKLADLLRDPQRRQQLAQQARESALKKFSLEDYGGRIAGIIRHVAAQKHPLGTLGENLSDSADPQRIEQLTQELHRVKRSLAWRAMERLWRLRAKLKV